VRFFADSVTVQPSASLLRNPAHLKFADRKGLDSLAEFTHSHGLCSRCKVLGWTVTFLQKKLNFLLTKKMG